MIMESTTCAHRRCFLFALLEGDVVTITSKMTLWQLPPALPLRIAGPSICPVWFPCLLV